MARWLLSVVLLILALPAGSAPSNVAAQSGDQRCFPETQQCISGRIAQYWEQNGGVAVLGFPVTAAAIEVNRDTGEPYLTQWFERNRLELHPENQPPYDVLLGRLGDDQLLLTERDWQVLPRADGPRADCLWFEQTGHNVCDQAPGLGFRRYWTEHGLSDPGLDGFGRSLALFGLPLTEPAMEANAAGDLVLTQWFERARFEWHPGKPDQFKVLLGLLGAEVFDDGPDDGLDPTPEPGESTPKPPPTPGASQTPTPAPASGSAIVDDRPEVKRDKVTALGENGAIWWRWIHTGGWSAYQAPGAPGRFTSGPAVMAWAAIPPNDGRVDIFARGPDRRLWHTCYCAADGGGGGGWQRWERLDGLLLTSAPAVISMDLGRMDVFARGEDDAIHQLTWRQIGGWSGWQSLGGKGSSAPAVTSWGPGRIDLVARGADDSLQHKSYTHVFGWTGWSTIDGPIVAAPAITTDGPNSLNVYARGVRGDIRGRSFRDGRWIGGWSSLGGKVASGPATYHVPGLLGRPWHGLRVFARGGNGDIWYKQWNQPLFGRGTWSKWRNLGRV